MRLIERNLVRDLECRIRMLIVRQPGSPRSARRA